MMDHLMTAVLCYAVLSVVTVVWLLVGEACYRLRHRREVNELERMLKR
jgi:hypothetical protein